MEESCDAQLLNGFNSEGDVSWAATWTEDGDWESAVSARILLKGEGLCLLCQYKCGLEMVVLCPPHAVEFS